MEVINVREALGLLIAKSIGVAEKISSSRYIIAAGGTESIDFGPVSTATFVLIYSRKGDVEVTFDGADTAKEINSGGFVLLHNTSVTSISIVEPDSSTTAIVGFVIGGS